MIPHPWNVDLSINWFTDCPMLADLDDQIPLALISESAGLLSRGGKNLDLIFCLGFMFSSVLGFNVSV